MMKKIILLSLLVSTLMWADSTDKVKSIETMQNLENGLATIQKGMMYNNRNIVEKGVIEIKLNTKNISDFDIKNERGIRFKAKKYSMTEALAIEKLAEDVLIAFDKKKRNRVLDTYRRLQDQCMTCHALVRKW